MRIRVSVVEFWWRMRRAGRGPRRAAHGRAMLDPALAGAVLQELSRVPAGVDSDPLTPCEQEVLRQLALGRTNRQIAEALTVGEETVKTHVGNVLAKLRPAHRTQAMIYALKRGLVAVDDLNLD